uniref:Sorting nexin 5 n=1 Tax=Molossus molossus TaxID=27622 RepID=A0A7J8HKP8_MOLMO|nr:sorting nexin 5 [Molossus molossus]
MAAVPELLQQQEEDRSKVRPYALSGSRREATLASRNLTFLSSFQEDFGDAYASVSRSEGFPSAGSTCQTPSALCSPRRLRIKDAVPFVGVRGPLSVPSGPAASFSRPENVFFRKKCLKLTLVS